VCSTDPDGRQCASTYDVTRWRSTHETWKVFSDLRKRSLYFDVVLRTDDGQTFPAHRLMLCTCGQYFRFVQQEENALQLLVELPSVMKVNRYEQFATASIENNLGFFHD